MSVRILAGHCIDRLRELPEESVHCCITSPPYYGLRDYKTEPQAWADGWVGDLGDEPSLQMYVAHLVDVFREVRRVLVAAGTLWLVIGDSYAGSWGAQGRRDTNTSGISRNQIRNHPKKASRTVPVRDEGMKAKDLMMVPAEVALALRRDGWWLRKEIIWHKPNPMPESTIDRPTSAHESVFLLAKSEHYFYDAAAIAEPATSGERFHGGYVGAGRRTRAENGRHRGGDNATATRNKRDVWTVPLRPFKDAHFAVFPPDLIRPMILAGCPVGGTVLDPFVGSGTTMVEAEAQGRSGIGIDLNADYPDMAARRVPPMFTTVEVVR